MRVLWRLGRAARAGGEEESWRTSASRGACTRHGRRGQEIAQLDREQSALQLQMDSWGHDQRVTAALAISLVVVARKDAASHDLVSGISALTRRQRRPYSVYVCCPVTVLQYTTKGKTEPWSWLSVLCLLCVVLGSTLCHKSSDTLCFCSCIIQTLSKVPQLAMRWHLINPGKRSNSHLLGTECTSWLSTVVSC